VPPNDHDNNCLLGMIFYFYVRLSLYQISGLSEILTNDQKDLSAKIYYFFQYLHEVHSPLSRNFRTLTDTVRNKYQN